MSEFADLIFNVICNVQFLMHQFVAASCLSMLCRDFTKTKRRTGLAGAAYFAVTVTLYFVPFPVDNLVAYSLGLLAAFDMLLLLDRRNIRMKIFLASVFFVLRWIAFSLSYRVLFYLYDAVEWGWRRMSGGKPMRLEYLFSWFLVQSLLELAVEYILLRFIVKKISGSFEHKQRNLQLHELGMLMIPVVCGIFSYEIFQIYAEGYEQETKVSIFEAHPITEFLWIFYHIFMLAMVLSSVSFYWEMQRKQEEEKSALMLERSVHDLRSHITEVEKLYTEMRGIRHDTKNHMMVVNALLEQEKTGEAKAYLQSLAGAVERLQPLVKTGNPVTDVIIQEQMREVGARDVRFQSEFYFPTESGIDVFDISAILSNALANAIEAAETGGFVRISSFCNKNAYLITVENSFGGKLLIDEESGLPQTTKADSDTHGIGLRNIKMVAEKYYGDIVLEQKENTVSLTVMLMAGN